MERKTKTREGAGKGLFVVIEGQDGTGKTTLAREIVAALTAHGVVALGTREPSGVFGQRIREAAREGVRLEPWEEMAHFCMARAQHWREVIEPALASGIVVVCDRWLYSTLVYNVPRICAAYGEASGERAAQMARASGVRADLCLCLLVSEDARLARIEARRVKGDALDAPGVRDAFDALPDLRHAYEAACGGAECVRMEGGGQAENLGRALAHIREAAGSRCILTVRGEGVGLWDALPRPLDAREAEEYERACVGV